MQDAQGNVVEWEVTDRGIVLVANYEPIMGVEFSDWDQFALMTARFNAEAENEAKPTVEDEKDVKRELPTEVGSLIILTEDYKDHNGDTWFDDTTYFIRVSDDQWRVLDGSGELVHLENFDGWETVTML